jgi:hypothetical protein
MQAGLAFHELILHVLGHRVAEQVEVFDPDHGQDEGPHGVAYIHGYGGLFLCDFHQQVCPNIDKNIKIDKIDVDNFQGRHFCRNKQNTLHSLAKGL